MVGKKRDFGMCALWNSAINWSEGHAESSRMKAPWLTDPPSQEAAVF